MPIVVTETLTKASRFLMVLVFPNQQALSDERRAQCDSAFNRDAVFPLVKVLREGGSHHIAWSSNEVRRRAVWRGGTALGDGLCGQRRSAATILGVLMLIAEFEEVNDVWFF